MYKFELAVNMTILQIAILIMIRSFYILIFSLTFFSLSAQSNENTTNNIIRHVVEVLPYYDTDSCADLEGKYKYRCAEDKLINFIYANLHYPVEAKDNEVTGVVVLKFIVERNGNLSNFEIIRDLEMGCGMAALEAVKKVEQFIPAQLNGKAVRTYYRIPIKFY